MSANSLMEAADRAASDMQGTRDIHELGLGLREQSSVEACELFDGAGPGEGFRTAGERELRPYGSSTRFTFTRTSLDLSGFAEDEPVTVYAADGAVLLVSNRNDEAQVERGHEYLAVGLDVANVPDEVADLLDDYEARITPSSVVVAGDGTLSFSVTLPSPFERVTERDVRPFGDSTAFTLPPESLEKAGLDDGDRVEVRAADGAVLLTRA